MKALLRFICLVAAVTLAGLRPVSGAVECGEPAPDFTLADLSGQTRSLSEFKGRTVVVEWNNPDCPIVRKHYESDNLPKLQREATADGVVWLLINSGARGQQAGDYASAELQRWLKDHHAAPTAYLRDGDGKVGRRYGARTTPHLFVINPAGVLVYQGAIDSIPSARKTDIAKAQNYVREALAAVKSGRPVAPANTPPYGCAVKY